MIRMSLMLVALLGTLPLHAAPAGVLVSGTEYCRDIVPIPIPFPPYGIEWGNLWSEISPHSDSGIALIAAGGQGRLLAIELPPVPDGPYRFNLLEIRADQTRTLLFSQEGFAGVGIVADVTGKIYVLGSNPLGTTLFVFNPAGTLVATYPLSGIEAFLQRVDLAADQCTLYYRLDDGILHRFNVCSGTPLASLPTASIHDVAVLPDGDLLVARGNQLRRYDQSGVLVQTYTFGAPAQAGPGIDAFGLAANGNRAVVHFYCEPEIRELDLMTGTVTVLAEPLTAIRGYATAIVPTDGWTAALGTGAAIGSSDVPFLGTAGLLALAGILALVGLRNLSQTA